MAVTAQFTDVPLSVNFPIGVREKIEAVAERDHVSLNAVVRHLATSSSTIDDLATGRVRVRRDA